MDAEMGSARTRKSSCIMSWQLDVVSHSNLQDADGKLTISYGAA